MNRLTLIAASAFLALPAAATESLGNYSACKRELRGAAAAACQKCVGSGSFYQKSSGVCGMAEGMHKSLPMPAEKLPPKPTSMPKTGTQYVTVPAGSFRIGSAAGDPDATDKDTFTSTVTISRPFLMKATEVTQGEWHFVVGTPSPVYDKACGADCPVGMVSFWEVLTYLNTLSKRDGLEPCYALKSGRAEWVKGLECKGYRLPTEAEWEYAARGGTDGARYGELDAIAWYSDNADRKRHPAGKKAANAYGLFDLIGSQWEWTWDQENTSSKPFEGEMTDPFTGGLVANEDGSSRIVRGGSWQSYASEARASHRYQMPPSSPGEHFGFRPVRTVFEKKP